MKFPYLSYKFGTQNQIAFQQKDNSILKGGIQVNEVFGVGGIKAQIRHSQKG